MYQALYRKWRPLRFADVIGQKHITDTLRAELCAGRLSHAYLFTGTRGTGKTTCAKILARAVNCQNPQQGDPCNECPACRGILDGSILDVVEIDAASNNGVDNIRDIRDQVQYTPANVAKRVYIIDEVHMLSPGAFNALLKTLEEPPPHVLFILATTEIHKVPATILSRCQRFDFRRIAPQDIAERLQAVAKEEAIDLTADGAQMIARLADGAMRDALSILDRTCTGQTIDAQSVAQSVGILGGERTAELMECIIKQQLAQAAAIIDECYTSGRELGAVLEQLLSFIRDILLVKSAKSDITALLNPAYTLQTIQSTAKLCDAGTLIAYTRILQECLQRMRNAANRRVEAELCMIRLCTLSAQDYDSLDERVGALEHTLQNGIPAAQVAVSAPAAPAPTAAAPAAPAPPKPAPPKPAYFADWAKLLDALSNKINTAAYVNLKLSARAIYQDNTLTILADDGVTAMLINAAETKDIIAQEASRILGTACVVKVKEEESQTPEDTSMVDTALGNARERGITVTQL